MYSTCIFCHSHLGTNEAIEEFAVGRRLAFDAAKGRLWAVCRACGRWNLSPLETRWEAVEGCERAFRGTRVRVSTANVGLARLAEGTELVRIGAPLRPEFAAWRYGDQFGRGARVGKLFGAGVVGSVAAVGSFFVLPWLPFLLAVPSLGLMMGAAHAQMELNRAAPRGLSRTRLGLVDDTGERILTPERALRAVHLRPAAASGEGWAIEIVTAADPPDEVPEIMEIAGLLFNPVRPTVDLNDGSVRLGRHWDQPLFQEPSFSIRRARRHAPAAAAADTEPAPAAAEIRHLLTGTRAMHAIALFMLEANASGASRKVVQEAVRRIEGAGSAERYFKDAERDARASWWGNMDLRRIPQGVRLALEMAAHEDAERRALEGELAELERQWRVAEEIATIADSLAVPPEVERRLRRMQSGQG